MTRNFTRLVDFQSKITAQTINELQQALEDDDINKANQSAVDAITPDTLNQWRVAWTGEGVIKTFGESVHLNDNPDIDSTGATDMGPTIHAYLATLAAQGVRRVYCDKGSTYLIGSTFDIPANMTLCGPQRMDQGASTATKAVFKAAADNVTICRIAGNYSNIDGLSFDLNNKLNAVAIRPNRHFQAITGCLFSHCDATSTAVRGGGILYFAMRDNVFSDGFSGRAVDLLDAYADNPAAVYYGVNVGWFERNIFAGPQGAFRAEGIFAVLHNDFEGGSGSVNPALEVSTASANSYAIVDHNYFEMTGASQGILIGTGSSVTVTNNNLSGVQATVGGYGVKGTSYCYRFVLKGNTLTRLETGAILPTITESNWGGFDVGPNVYSFCTTNTTGGTNLLQQSWTDTTRNQASAVMQRGDGRVAVRGALVQGSGRIYSASGSVIDLRAGNSFQFIAGVASSVTAAGAAAGQFITLTNSSGGGVTLPNATWHPIEGIDVTLQNGETRQFVVTYDGVIREIAPAALTRIDPGVAGQAGQQLAPTISGVKWRRGDYVTPADFGGVGDGIVDDYAAIMQAYAALGGTGGKISLLGKKWKSSQPLTFTTAVTLEGGGGGFSTASTNWSGELIFPSNVAGVVFQSSVGISGACIRNVTLTGANAGLGTADGLTIKMTRWRVDNVVIRNFSRYGAHIAGDSSDSTNANDGTWVGGRILTNKSDGIRIEGTDSNICTFMNPSVEGNSGYGIYNDGAKNTFINAHASGNLASVSDGVTTLTADYADQSLSSTWINPYSEGSKAFAIVTAGTSPSATGYLLSVGTYAPPTIWSGQPGTWVANASGAVTAGWVIIDRNKHRSWQTFMDAAGTVEWRIQPGINGLDTIGFRQATAGKTPLSFRADGTRVQLGDGTDLDTGTVTGSKIGFTSSSKLAFFGATPTTKPAAITTSTNATLNSGDATTDSEIANMRTRIADLEARLKSLGLLS